jgi:hypothetical protein
MNFRSPEWKAVWLLLMQLVIAGCATSPATNWDRRVGNYTYELALADLGTPDYSTALSNGGLVADWVTREGHPGTLAFGAPPYSGPPSAWESPVPQTVPPTPNYHLRLTFDRDQRLVAWNKYWSYAE